MIRWPKSERKSLAARMTQATAHPRPVLCAWCDYVMRPDQGGELVFFDARRHGIPVRLCDTCVFQAKQALGVAASEVALTVERARLGVHKRVPSAE